MTPIPKVITPIPPATTLSYEQSAVLMTDLPFRGRVKTACLRYASYILDEPASVPAHNTRVRWAQSAFVSPDNTAAMVQSPVVMDPAVQEQGSAIPDEALQTAVEDTVSKII